MNVSRRTLALIALAALPALCASAQAQQREFSAKAVTLRVVDEADGAPLEDVIATANWELESSSFLGVSHVRTQIHVVETISGKDGAVRFAAWGPKPNRQRGRFAARDPQIFLYKTGYVPVRLNNMNKYGAVPRPDVPGGFSTDALRVSAWDGETIFMAKRSGGKHGYLQASVSGIDSGLHFAYYDGSCDWKRMPRMTAVLLEARYVNPTHLDHRNCGSR